MQRFQQRKQAVLGWVVEKKLEKLAIYSTCQEDSSCKCNGWKNPNPPANPSRPRIPMMAPTDPCDGCGHALSSHVSHLQVQTNLGNSIESICFPTLRMPKRLNWTNCLGLPLTWRICLCAPTKRKILTQNRWCQHFSWVWFVNSNLNCKRCSSSSSSCCDIPWRCQPHL